MGLEHRGRKYLSLVKIRVFYVMRVCNDVTLGLTTADWFWPRINELLVTAQKGLTQWDLPAPGPPNVWTAQSVSFSENFQCNEAYLEGHSLKKSWIG